MSTKVNTDSETQFCILLPPRKVFHYGHIRFQVGVPKEVPTVVAEQLEGNHVVTATIVAGKKPRPKKELTMRFADTIEEAEEIVDEFRDELDVELLKNRGDMSPVDLKKAGRRAQAMKLAGQSEDTNIRKKSDGAKLASSPEAGKGGSLRTRSRSRVAVADEEDDD